MSRSRFSSGILFAVLGVASVSALAFAEETPRQMLPPVQLSTIASSTPATCGASPGSPRVLVWDGVNALGCSDAVYVDAHSQTFSLHTLEFREGSSTQILTYTDVKELLDMKPKIEQIVRVINSPACVGKALVVGPNGTLTCNALPTPTAAATCEGGLYTEGQTWSVNTACPAGTQKAGTMGTFTMLCTSQGTQTVSSDCNGGTTINNNNPPASTDPCEAANAAPGTQCTDGTVYAGMVTQNNVTSRLYTTHCDLGQTWTGSGCSGSRIEFTALVNKKTGLMDPARTYTVARVYSSSRPKQIVTETASPQEASSLVSQINNSCFDGDHQMCYGDATPNYAFGWVAVDTCRGQQFGGKTGWEIPTRAELRTMYQNRDSIKQFTQHEYWTSEYRGSHTSIYWLDMASGGEGYAFWDAPMHGPARCVLKR